jgi:cold shock protein
MEKGQVVFFNAGKGFGFIRPEAGGPDIFVHYTGIASTGGYRTLQDGADVEYEIGDRDGRPIAINARPVDASKE